MEKLNIPMRHFEILMREQRVICKDESLIRVDFDEDNNYVIITLKPPKEV